jgi:hypothetical protein
MQHLSHAVVCDVTTNDVTLGHGLRKNLRNVAATNKKKPFIIYNVLIIMRVFLLALCNKSMGGKNLKKNVLKKF